MLKKLRLKFVVINMALVTAMLCAIFGLIYHFTRLDLERENLSMMRAVAAFPALGRLDRPDEPAEEVRLPYFVLQVEAGGGVSILGGGYYDLSDTAFLQELAGQAARDAADFGVLEDYKLRLCRVETPAGERLVFSDISSEQATLEGLARSLAVTGALSFAAFLGLSLLLARWAVKPVERAWRQQQQFVADASHELKTPLAEEALLPFEPLLFERGLTLTPCIQPGITVRGREGPLRQVLEILLDNAQKYAVPPSAVYLHLARSGRSRCRLMVENRAATLPPEELENIFKRFYRVDKARSRDGSFGLGLPIARQIVSAHRGRIWAESHGERIRFYVELPLA